MSDENEISLAVAELDAGLRGAFLQEARQPSEGDILLEFRIPGRTLVLLLSASHEFSRIHLVHECPQNPQVPFAFQSLLRARACGEKVLKIEQVGNDRVVKIFFSGDYTLVAELTGRHSNIFLCHGAEEIIIGSLLPSKSIKRELLPGRLYQKPFARPGQEAVFKITPASPGRTSLALGSTLQLESTLQLGSTLPLVAGDDFPFNKILEEKYAPLVAASEVEKIKISALGAINVEKKRLARLIANIEGDLSKVTKAPRFRRLGEVLKTSLHLVKKGSLFVRLPEYSESGTVELDVPLRPELSPRENMERYFKTARRYSDAAARIEGRRDEALKKTTRLENILLRLNELQDLEELKKYLIKCGLAPVKRESKISRGGDGRERKPYKEYFIKGAGRFLAGISAAENDELTFRIARGNDLWFHTAGFAGSHVVAPMSRGQEPSRQIIEAGAVIAASRSRAPEGEKVEVAYTFRKYLRKPRGGKPGQVLVSMEKRILVAVKKGAYSECMVD